MSNEGVEAQQCPDLPDAGRDAGENEIPAALLKKLPKVDETPPDRI